MKYLLSLLGLVTMVAFNNCSATAEFEQSASSLDKFSKFDNGFEIPEEELAEIPDINDDDCQSGQVCLVIRDNFERSKIIGNDFAWSTFLDDLGRGLNGLSVAISDHAPASYGNNAVYFTGRPGNSVHSLYLISKPFDLRGFSKVTIEFDYLMASFETYHDGSRKGGEHIRVDMCSEGLSECGLNVSQSQARKRLNDSDRWKMLFADIARSPVNQQFNGNNHSSSSFTKVRENMSTIDLNKPGIDKSQVILRWNVLIDEGFDSANPDAGIIDNIVVRAYR